MSPVKQLKLLNLIAHELQSPRAIKAVPPLVAAVQYGYVPSTNKYLYHIVLLNGEGIYGCREGILGEIKILDPWDWLSIGGVQMLAMEHGLED